MGYLVVDVLARRRISRLNVHTFYVLCKVSLGGKVDAKRRRAPEWPGARWRDVMGQNVLLHAFSPKEPWWTLEAYAGDFWRAPAGYAVEALEGFVEDHYDAIDGRASR